MKRTHGHLLGVGAVFSLFFCGLFAGCWLLSRNRTDGFNFPCPFDDHVVVAQSEGQLLIGTGFQPSHSFEHVVMPANQGGLGLMMWWFIFGDRESAGWSHAGFGFAALSDGIPGEKRTWAFFWPHWSMVAITSIIPVICLGKWLRKRSRWREGQCRRCGYDLRATPDRCPECGEAVKAGVETAGHHP